MIVSKENKHRESSELLLGVCLMVLVLFNVGLTALRVYHTQHLYFVFLVWNLFLALLPLVGVVAARHLQRRGAATSWIVLLVGATIAFLPNAPYLITDLYHLRSVQPSRVIVVGYVDVGGLCDNRARWFLCDLIFTRNDFETLLE